LTPFAKPVVPGFSGAENFSGSRMEGDAERGSAEKLKNGNAEKNDLGRGKTWFGGKGGAKPIPCVNPTLSARWKGARFRFRRELERPLL